MLPDWWDAECFSDRSLVADIEIRVARFLGKPLSVVRDLKAVLEIQQPKGVKLRKVFAGNPNRLAPAVHAGMRVAEAVVRSLRKEVPQPKPPPANAKAWHGLLLDKFKRVDLEAIVRDLWQRGIPVIQVSNLPSPKFQGLACIVAGRPAIVLGHDLDTPARLGFLLSHEVGHVSNGDCTADGPVVDENDAKSDNSKIEERADAYAWDSLLAGTFLVVPEDSDPRAVAAEAERVATAHRIDAGALIWKWTNQVDKFDVGQMALRALYAHKGGPRVVRQHFEANVDFDSAGETDRALLELARGEATSASSPD